MMENRQYLLDLLDTLQTSLHGESRGEEAALVTTLRDRLTRGDNPVSLLEELYAVKGCDRFALRLLWYVEECPVESAVTDDKALADFRVGQLAGDLARSFPAAAPAAPSRPARREDWESSVWRFGVALEALRRDAFDEGRFVGLRRSFLESIEREAGGLEGAARAERNEEVARFGEAFRRFVRYICDGNLNSDVRVLNFLESANLTLQTAVRTLGPDDFDSLRQTTLLLESPDTLFEPPRREPTR